MDYGLTCESCSRFVSPKVVDTRGLICSKCWKSRDPRLTPGPNTVDVDTNSDTIDTCSDERCDGDRKEAGFSLRGRDISGHKFWNENWADFTSRFDKVYLDSDRTQMKDACGDAGFSTQDASGALVSDEDGSWGSACSDYDACEEDSSSDSLVCDMSESSMSLVGVDADGEEDGSSGSSSGNTVEIDALEPVLCRNCRREELSVEEGDPKELTVTVVRVSVEVLTFRHRWKSFSRRDIGRSQTHVSLCLQCKAVLTREMKDESEIECEDSKPKKFQMKDVWPVYIYKMLTDEEMICRYGSDALHFVPKQWWKYYKSGLVTDYPLIYLDSDWEEYLDSVPVVVDRTFDKRAFRDILNRNLLGELKHGCDRYLKACVLCPWGCAGFLHDAGCLHFDAVISHFFPFLGFVGTLSSVGEKGRVVSSRQDFFSFSIGMHLFNAEWTVHPSVYFDDALGPVFLTCDDHHGGTKDKYFHVPKSGSSLPPFHGDQLSFVVLRARTLRNAQARLYSNMYQMNLLQGNFSGVDSTWISDERRRFDFHSHISQMNEARTYRGREDIRGLVGRLMDGGNMDHEFVEDLDNQSRVLYPEMSKLEKMCRGSTMMSLVDVMQLQRTVSRTDYLEMCIGDRSSNVFKTVVRPWPVWVVKVHPYDSHGANMLRLGPMRSKQLSDCRLLWFLGHVLMNVNTLWHMVAENVCCTSQWHGHVLAYLNRVTVKQQYKRIRDQTHPFYVNSFSGEGGPMGVTQKMFDFMELADGGITVGDMFQRLFSEEVQQGKVVFLKFRFMDVLQVSETCDVLWFINMDRRRDIKDIEEYLHIEGVVFELRFLASIECGSSIECNNWNGSVWMRHGSSSFPSWWSQDRKGKYRLPTRRATLSDFDWCNIDWCIYVRVRSVDLEQYRREYLTYVGGQSIVGCMYHDVPLITSPPVLSSLLCGRSADGEDISSNEKCVRRVNYRCPVDGCCVGICRQCLTLLPSDRFTLVEHGRFQVQSYESRQEEGKTDDNCSTSDESVYEGCSIVGSSSDDSLHFRSRLEGSFSDGSSSSDADSYDVEELPFSVEDLHTGSEAIGVGTGECDPSNDVDLEDTPIVPTTHVTGDSVPITGKMRGFGTSVLLNKCASMLVRRKTRLQASKTELNLIERVVSQKDVGSVPLVYLEGVLFPSIFWRLSDSSDSGILGSIPTVLFCQNRTRKAYGIASLADHAKTRLKSIESTASTSPQYLSFLFDSLANAAVEGHDTRIVLNRGFESCMGPAGMRLRGKDDDLYTDGIDNRQNVHNLCSAERVKPTTLFVTMTCNQSRHFGVWPIKHWVDSGRALESYKDYLRTEFPDLNELSTKSSSEVQMALSEASRSLIVRHWLEVKTFIVRYLLKSTELPLGKVFRLFGRDEFQGDTGNLPHMHLLVTLEKDYATEEGRAEIQSVVRGYVDDIVTDDEVERCIEDGILQDFYDYRCMKDDARTFLPHYHSPRCLRRTGPGVDDVKCRVPDARLITDDIVSFFEAVLHTRHSKESVDILERLGLVRRDDDLNVVPECEFLQAKRIYPPVRHGEGCITPVVGRLFAATRSTMNVQVCTSHGTSRYVVKYVIKIDENNYVAFSSKQGQPGLRAEKVHLHNTKITSSRINERKRLARGSDFTKPRGRAIAVTEMMQIILGKPQVVCNVEFVRVPTLPLGERAGLERQTPQDKFDEIVERGLNVENKDSFDFMVPMVRYRDTVLRLANYRCHTPSQEMMLRDQMLSKVTLDRVFIFGVRPPELLSFDKMEWYFRLFERSRSPVITENVGPEHFVKKKLMDSALIDGLGHRIRIRPNAIDTIRELLDGEEMRRDFRRRRAVPMLNMLEKICLYHGRVNFDDDDPVAINIQRQRLKLDGMFVAHYDAEVPLPVVVFSNVRPNNACKFAIHLLLSMGHFETERDLWIGSSMTLAFRKARLIPTGQGTPTESDVDKLLKYWIEDQLRYYPIGSSLMDQYIVSANGILKSLLLHDAIPITEVPPVMYTSLVQHTDQRITEFLENARENLIDATLRSLGDAYSAHPPHLLPTKDVLKHATKQHHCDWDPVVMPQTASQSDASYEEQVQVQRDLKQQVDQYRIPQTRQPKNMLVAGPPGVGKTHSMTLSVCYTLSKGLCAMTTAILAERAYLLGGKHLHLLFKLRVRDGKTPHRLAELAVMALERNPEFLALLRLMDVLYLDEGGQLCAELLSVLDIISRKVRNSDLFMGGMLIVGTIDQEQLRPIKGLPFLLSPYVLTTFRLRLLKHYVRCADCLVLQEMNELARNLNCDDESRDSKLERLRYLVSENCKFVESWDDPVITDEVLRVFPRKEQTATAIQGFLRHRRQLAQEDGSAYHQICATDSMIGLESHADWKPASSSIVSLLNRDCREQQQLDFYKGAIYQFTYNCPGRFKSTQLCVLLTVPPIETLQAYKDIEVWAAPPGTKTLSFVLNEESLVVNGFEKVKVGACPERSMDFWDHGVKGKRRQYALKLHIASTIHSAIGHTVTKLATQLSEEHSIWERAMVVVLISRVRRACDLIFVGDKTANINALIDGLKHRNQYDEYMDHIVAVLADESGETPPLLLSRHPFRYKDIPLPLDTSGVVYMLVSSVDGGSMYIGCTQNMQRRLNQHNSGFGARESAPIEKRPWGLYAYVTGFGGDRNLMQLVERQWQLAVQGIGPSSPREAIGILRRFINVHFPTNIYAFTVIVADEE